AHTLVAFAPSLMAFALARPLIQAFYAQGNTKTPVKVGVVTLVINFLLGLMLLRFEVVGIASALSVSSFFQYFLLFYLFKTQANKEFKANILRPICGHISIAGLSCSIGSLFAKYGNWELGFNIRNAVMLFGSIAFVAALYGILAYLLKFDEALKIVHGVLRMLRLKR
ncbi:MAG: lipid II flippase MurJ, partial [Minisyncoccia bacterium]